MGYTEQLAVPFCNHVVPKLTPENSVWFSSKIIGNEFKGASSSSHPKMRTKPTNKSNDMIWRTKTEKLGSCRITFVVLCVYSQTEMFKYRISVSKM